VARGFAFTGAGSLALTTIVLAIYAFQKPGSTDFEGIDDYLLGVAIALNPITAICLILAAKGIAKSVSDRLKAQREVARQKAWLDAIVQQMPVGVGVLTNSAKDLVLANQQFYDLFRIERQLSAAAKSRGTIRAFNTKGEFCTSENWPSRRALDTGKPVINEELSIELANGKHIWTLVSAAPISEPSGLTAIIMTYWDITQRKDAENHRNRLMRGIIAAQEEERLRIARELHDELGQDLTALSIGLKGLEAEIGPRLAQSVKRLRNCVGEMNDHVHQMTSTLRPLMLEDFGLRHSLEELASNWAQRLGAEVQVSLHDLDHPIPDHTAIVVYRVVQEALTNIAKHAKASSIHLEGSVRGKTLRIEVTDNGCGFDPSLTIRRAAHFGLAGMVERISTVGGTLEIRSHPGAGTTIHAVIPYNEGTENGDCQNLQGVLGR
jgi:signal transduction histidine kinase